MVIASSLSRQPDAQRITRKIVPDRGAGAAHRALAIAAARRSIVLRTEKCWADLAIDSCWRPRSRRCMRGRNISVGGLNAQAVSRQTRNG
jgi:hypothetical protein